MEQDGEDAGVEGVGDDKSGVVEGAEPVLDGGLHALLHGEFGVIELGVGREGLEAEGA